MNRVSEFRNSGEKKKKEAKLPFPLLFHYLPLKNKKTYFMPHRDYCFKI